MSLGLKRGTVQLEPHDKRWDDIAIQTIKTLKFILGDDAIDIQHIGSTAIPAIKAKPIIDIVVGVTDFERIISHNEQLQKEGIFYRGSDVEHQVLYVMGDMEKDIRTHHIHVASLAVYAMYERKKIATYRLEAIWGNDATNVKQVADRQKEIENILLCLRVKIYNNSCVIKQNIRFIEVRKYKFETNK